MSRDWTPEAVEAVKRRNEAGKSLQQPAKGLAGQPGRTSKYRNQRVVIDGEVFDSKREYAYWQELKLREKAGEVKDIKRQVVFHLCAPVTDRSLRLGTPAVLESVTEYRADFVFQEQWADREHPMFWREIVADVKGAKRNPERYELKKRWMKAQYGIEIREVR